MSPVSAFVRVFAVVLLTMTLSLALRISSRSRHVWSQTKLNAVYQVQIIENGVKTTVDVNQDDTLLEVSFITLYN